MDRHEASLLHALDRLEDIVPTDIQDPTVKAKARTVAYRLNQAAGAAPKPKAKPAPKPSPKKATKAHAKKVAAK